MARSGREFRDSTIQRKQERAKRGFSNDTDRQHQPPIRFRQPTPAVRPNDVRFHKVA